MKKAQQLRPLTRCNKSGVQYERTPEVDLQITEALGLDIPSLLARAENRDYKTPTFLQEECLVYLIRDYLIRKDDNTAGALAQVLFRRCANFIKSKFVAFDEAIAGEA